MELIANVESEALAAIDAAKSTAELREHELAFMGKNGSISGLMREIGKLPNEEKPKFGAAVNQSKAKVQAALEAKTEALKNAERSVQFEKEKIDVTMPSRPRTAARSPTRWRRSLGRR